MTDPGAARLIVTCGGTRRRARVEPGGDEATVEVVLERAETAAGGDDATVQAVLGRGEATAGGGALDAPPGDASPGDAGPAGAGAGAGAGAVTVRLVSRLDDTYVVSIEGRSTVVRVAPAGGGGHHAMTGGDAFEVAPDPGAADAGRAAAHRAAAHRAARDGAAPDRTAATEAAVTDAAAATGAPDLDALCAPMPATVAAILVDPGSAVVAGDTLVRLEAMKMELAIRAPAPGRVATVECRVGELVQPGRPLVTLEPRPATALDRQRGS